MEDFMDEVKGSYFSETDKFIFEEKWNKVVNLLKNSGVDLSRIYITNPDIAAMREKENNMKIGDVVVSTKVRPNERAKIVQTFIKQAYNEKKGRLETRTKYFAEFDDERVMIFYGFDINRTIFKVEETNGQITMEEYLREVVE